MIAQRALVLGHFSTVGDIQCLEHVAGTLQSAGLDYDVAPFSANIQRAIPNSIAIASANPRRYSHVVVVCGPCSPEIFQKNGLDIGLYRHCTRIGINLTMLKPLQEWNPFDLLLERDSDRTARPDLTFLVEAATLTVAGRCTIARQREYGSRQRHGAVIAQINDLIERRGLAVVDVDTRWPNSRNQSNLSSPAAVNSVISKLDVLITNRLHGLVFALRAGVPVLAIDSVAGGDKLTAQARVLEWPLCMQADDVTPQAMDLALDWCLTEAARSAAIEARERAIAILRNNDQIVSEGFSRQYGNFSRMPESAAPSGWKAAVQRLKNALSH